MNLYSFFNSSAAYRVRIAIALKGLDVTMVSVSLRRNEQRAATFLEKSPAGLIPFFEDGELSFGQSLAIIQYLDEKHPEPRLIPLDWATRAPALEIAYGIACDIHPLNNLRVLGYLKQNLALTDDQKNAWYRHWIQEGLTTIEALLARQDGALFCIGNTPTIADCCLIPQVANALRFDCPLDEFPRIRRIYQHCLTLPAFIAASPGAQVDFVS